MRVIKPTLRKADEEGSGGWGAGSVCKVLAVVNIRAWAQLPAPTVKEKLDVPAHPWDSL